MEDIYDLREREREREYENALLACFSETHLISSSQSLPRFPMSPSMAPNDQQGQRDDELHLSGDKSFAAHGEAMMVVLVLIFALFLSFLLLFYYLRLRWRRNPQLVEDSGNSNPPKRYPLSVFKGEREDLKYEFSLHPKEDIPGL